MKLFSLKKAKKAKVVSARKAKPAKEATEKAVSAKKAKAAEMGVELPPAVEAAGVGGDLADPVSFVATVTLETGELSPVFPPTAVRLKTKRLPTRSSLSGHLRSKLSKQVCTDLFVLYLNQPFPRLLVFSLHLSIAPPM